jgi:hypothetical protein
MKKIRAARHAIESFLHHLHAYRVLLREDNTAVIATLTKLTTRSPIIMAELRRLCYLPNTNDIRIRPRYVRSVGSIWAGTLNRELDIEEWKLNPEIFSIIQQ